MNPDDEAYLVRQEALMLADEVMQNKSEDYKRGFEDGANWLNMFVNKVSQITLDELRGWHGSNNI